MKSSSWSLRRSNERESQKMISMMEKNIKLYEKLGWSHAEECTRLQLKEWKDRG